ncbi:unnamed protein product [Paramecium sonneborni]|uniref:Uncharacterized protein n=1 Tax=Paramecium sonneborni TaxID=65129 RepID=A0A8S1P9A4_9CILI|nr:unnamed protein product [Paramecium sonneborni]
MQEIDLFKLHQETQKYLEIENIFKRLTNTFLNKIYQLIKDIFDEEQKFTIQVHNRYKQELLKLAKQKKIPFKEFKLAEHYKSNSQIFKTNLQAIISIIIDDLQNYYNKQIMIEESTLLEPRQLTQIDEESQINLTENINEITEDYSQNRYNVKTEETPKLKKELKYQLIKNKYSLNKNSLANLLSFDKSTCLSMLSSARHSRENSINNKRINLTNKNILKLITKISDPSSLQQKFQVKNKSLELNYITEYLSNQNKIPKRNQTMLSYSLKSNAEKIKENFIEL